MDIKSVFERQHKRIYRLAYIYFKNAPDSEDAVQNIFIKYMKNPHHFESEAHENAWFITATRNYCKDIFRSFWRKNIDLGDVPDRVSNENDDYLTDFIMKLPEKYREVIFLYYYEGYSVKEIAFMLHKKESTVQTWLFDARKKLKDILEKEGNYRG